MKIFTVDFEGLFPVGNCLIIAANNKKEALEIASKTIEHQQVSLESISEVDISKPCVIEYLDGDY